MDMASRVGKFLLDHKCPPLNGYFYLKEGLPQIMQNMGSCVGCVSKCMYHHVAEKFNTDVPNVERCIRTLIQKWDMSNLGLFDSVPTNRELIIKLAEYFKLMYID